MKIMNCPLNGPRNIRSSPGAAKCKPMPDPASLDDRDWAD